MHTHAKHIRFHWKSSINCILRRHVAVTWNHQISFIIIIVVTDNLNFSTSLTYHLTLTPCYKGMRGTLSQSTLIKYLLQCEKQKSSTNFILLSMFQQLYLSSLHFHPLQKFLLSQNLIFLGLSWYLIKYCLLSDPCGWLEV